MFLAFTEMRRARLRFGFLTGAVGLLVFLILFQQSLLDGLVTQFIGAVRNQDAQVIVYGRQARKNLEGSLITDAQFAAVTAVTGVADAGRLGQGTFTVSTAVSRAPAAKDRLVDAVLFGYDLGHRGKPTTLLRGRLPAGPREAVTSANDADAGFALGDRIRIEPGGEEITVVGTAADTNYSVAPTLFVAWDTYAAARRIRNPDASAVLPSAVAVQPSPGIDPKVLAARITEEVAGTEGLTRSQAVEGSPGVSSVRSSFDTIINLLRFVVLLTTGLFFLILTVQKTASLTLLRAIGARASTLVTALFIQVLVVTLGGVLFAAALQSVAVKGASSVSARFSWADVPSAAVVVLALALIATAIGATRRILRIDPAAVTSTQGMTS